jgi:uncharacterized transporter YbjL
MGDTNGWHEYKHLVLDELERIDEVLGKHLEKCDASIQNLLREVISIKDGLNARYDDKIAQMNEKINKTENKVSNIYAVGVFCGVATGVIIGIINIIVSNFL